MTLRRLEGHGERVEKERNPRQGTKAPTPQGGAPQACVRTQGYRPPYHAHVAHARGSASNVIYPLANMKIAEKTMSPRISVRVSPIRMKSSMGMPGVTHT